MLTFALIKAHLQRAVLPTSATTRGQAPSFLNAAVGGVALAAPLFLSASRGQLPIGLDIALGALSVSRVSHANHLSSRLKAPWFAFVAASLAILSAYLLSGHGLWSEIATILLASCSVLLMRVSREVAIGVIRFMLFLIIFANALEATRVAGAVAIAIFVGVAWTALFVAVVELFATGTVVEQQASKAPPGTLNKLKRVGRELTHLSFWDFPLRLAIGLALSLVVRALLPQHHFGWITVTVALVTPRQFEIWPIRATQRTLGTLAGVIATGLTSMVTLPDHLLIVLLMLLGALRKWFEDQNYLAYSAVMAPLVLLLLTASHPGSYGLLLDRVLATLIGVALVLLSNLVAARTTASTALRGAQAC
jgi:hypothetical protein